MSRRDLSPVFAPRSVAVVGASDDTMRIGGRVFRNLLTHGYKGELIPVNPRSVTVQGMPARSTVGELDSAVDLAVLAVNGTRTSEVVEQLLADGTRNFLSFAAGADARMLTSLLDACGDGALVGPNSNGIWSVREHLIASFGSEAERDEILDGPVAIVAHSGSLGGAVARRLQDEGVGTGYLVSAGNELDLSIADYIQFFITDPTISVIGMYVEGVRDGPRLKEALYQAKDAGVLVVALLAGLSRAAREATSSHTGKSLSSPGVYRAILEECGVAIVHSVSDLVGACCAASGPTNPAVPRIGALGISGGMLALIADSCDAAGLTFAPLTNQTTTGLERHLPPFSTAINPVDLTGAVLEHEDLLPRCARAVAQDPGVDALVVGLDNKGYQRITAGPWIEQLARDVRKPIAMVLWDEPRDRQPDLEALLRNAGVLVVTDPSDVGVTLRWTFRSDQVDAGGPMVVSAASPGSFTHEQLQTWVGQLAFAAAVGLETAESVEVTGDTSDRDAIGRLAPPLVVKALPNRMQHKTDHGMVVTGLTTHQAAIQTAQRFRQTLPEATPVLVQRQVAGVEVLVALSTDPDWGPILTVGGGGPMVELLADLVTLPLPCPRHRIERALRRTRVWALLSGFRGKPRADIEALLGAVEHLQEAFLASPLREVELNPIMVAPEGQGAFMIDLLTSDEGPRHEP